MVKSLAFAPEEWALSSMEQEWDLRSMSQGKRQDGKLNRQAQQMLLNQYYTVP